MKKKKFLSLAPTKSEKCKAYSSALEYALEDKDIKNIAITGIYGSGKSSIIKTFFNWYRKILFHPIFISLASFENEKSEGGNNDDDIEKSILQQLIYQEKGKALPLSRFKRIYKPSFKDFLSKVSIIVAIITFIFLLIPDKLKLMIDNFNSIKGLLNLNDTAFKYICIICSGFTLWAVYHFAALVLAISKVKKVKIKDAEIELVDKSDSIFNQYLDEILYFFQAREHKVVIIEDLDRYGNVSLPVFQRLRELNILINSSEQVKYPVKFLYAIKDDLFCNEEDRTKFFDFIIPIIPISSSENSNEIIWNHLAGIKNNFNLAFEFEKDFINDISFLISDRRMINNVINEFIIYKEEINDSSIDDKQLFSMIIYKNLFPSEYSKMQKGKGKIVDVMRSREEYLKLLNEKNDNDINELEEKKKRVCNETFRNIKELKYALIFNLLLNNIRYNISNTFFYINNIKYSTIDFLDDNFDINIIKNFNVIFSIDREYNEEEVFKFFTNKQAFVERIENIEKTKDISLKEIEQEIKQINDKAINISKLPMTELVKNEEVHEKMKDRLDEKELFLISRGYITEEFNDYITLFIPGDLTEKDKSFVRSAKFDNVLDYDYHLEKMDNIVEKLNDRDYDNKAILNYDLLNHLIEQNNKKRIIQIINVLDSLDNELVFVDGFIEKYGKNEAFLDELVCESHNLWKKIYARRGEVEYIDEWVIRYLQNISSINNLDDYFKLYVTNHKYIDKYITEENQDVIIKSLNEFQIRLGGITQIHNKEFLALIYKNDLYELNDRMIKIMLQVNDVNTQKFKSKNLSIIMNNEGQLKNRVLDDFVQYYYYCYNRNPSNEDDEFAIMGIIKNDSIPIEIKKGIITKEKFNRYIIDGINQELYEIIINDNKLKPWYGNVLEIYKNASELSDCLANHISKNMEYYLEHNINEYANIFTEELIDNFKYDYAINKNVSISDFIKLVPTFNIKYNDIEKIDDSEKIRFMVQEGMISFNEKNYTFLYKTYKDILIPFIECEIDEYTQHINEFNDNEIKESLLNSKNIDSKYKDIIVKYVNINDLKNETIMKLLLEDFLDINDKSQIEKVLQSDSIGITDKIMLLKKLLLQIDIETGTEYLHLLNNGYENINTNSAKTRINKENIDKELIRLLIIKQYISSSNERENQYILQNKRKRK